MILVGSSNIVKELMTQLLFLAKERNNVKRMVEIRRD